LIEERVSKRGFKKESELIEERVSKRGLIRI
jgi:hypothetical protein